jgi:conjugal transfer pilus assembly protein TraW
MRVRYLQSLGRFLWVLGLLFIGELFLQRGDVCAKDLGTFGETFAIREESLITYIKRKLMGLEEHGALTHHQHIIQNRVKESIRRPQRVKGITATKVPRVFTVDPTITVRSDLKDHTGKTFHHKGERVNPLDSRSLSHPLLFINGDDKIHIQWAQRHLKKDPLGKVILIQGDPFALMEELHHKVYFDQGGNLTAKLNLSHAPSFVSQKGKRLEIREEVPDA